MPVTVSCSRCATAFKVDPYRASTAKYCSRACKDGERVYFNCDQCGSPSDRHRSAFAGATNHFCSPACHDQFRRKGLRRACGWCGESFTMKPSRPVGKFCSHRCRADSQIATQVQMVCQWCGSSYRLQPSRAKVSRFCSSQCSGAHRTRSIRTVSVAEQTFLWYLTSACPGFEPQARIGKRLVDAAYRRERLAVEFDGDYWHSRPGAAERDARKDADIAASGYQVVRVPERVFRKDPYDAVDLVRQALKRRAVA